MKANVLNAYGGQTGRQAGGWTGDRQQKAKPENDIELFVVLFSSCALHLFGNMVWRWKLMLVVRGFSHVVLRLDRFDSVIMVSLYVLLL